MNRILKLQRLALDESISLLGNSSGSSTRNCCNDTSQDPESQR